MTSGNEGDTDPVLESVRAYSAHAAEYAHRYEQHMLNRPTAFAASLDVPSRILDAGCGPGRDLGLFAAHGHEAIGYELNPDFLAMASLRAPTVNGDLRAVATQFPAAHFDGVWAQASLVHLSEAETIDVIGQFAQLLRPGGRFFTCVPTRGHTGWLDEADGRRWYTVWHPSHFGSVVSAAGFQVDELIPGPYVEVWATRS